MDSVLPDQSPHGHASAELLSAYLDRRVGPAEAMFLQRHLRECAGCSSELAGLSGVRGLLRSLPRVSPPRSFVIAEPAPIARFPRLVVWTRAVGAVAAAFFVILVSLDLLGLGAAATVPMTDQNRAVMPTPAVARPASARLSEAPRPAAAPGAAAARSEFAGQEADRRQAEATVESLTASPMEPLAQPAPMITPLRLLVVASGALAVVLIAASMVVSRRPSGR
jgi:hypothetical protein